MIRNLRMLDVTNYSEIQFGDIQYSSGKRTKKLFIPNIGISQTSQKHLESNRVNVIFGGHHSQVRRKYVLCEVTGNGYIVSGGNISRERFLYIYLFNKQSYLDISLINIFLFIYIFIFPSYSTVCVKVISSTLMPMRRLI